MGISNYLGTKSENELIENAKSEELDHIKSYPEGEKEEIRQIFAKKGFKEKELENAVDTITSDINRWVEIMLQDEHGFSLANKSPVKSGLATFIINWLLPGTIAKPFVLFSVLTAIAFFLISAFKTRFVGKSWYLNGMEILIIGGIAALIAFYIVRFLKELV